MDHRYNAKHLRFEVRDIDADKLRNLYDALKMKDLIVLKPEATRRGWFSCYGTKVNGKPFNLNNGTKSLAKKLRVKPDDLSMIEVHRNCKMPDNFFELLKPDSLDDQIFVSMGRFADKLQIKAYIQQALTQNKNKHVSANILRKGAMKAVEEGVISVGQMKAAKAYQAEVANMEEKEKRIAKDLPTGKEVVFTCYKTDKCYKITSHLGDNKSDGTQSFCENVVDEETGTRKLVLKTNKGSFEKKKHYYFYSNAPGYGKTTTVGMLLEHTNSSVVNDPNNWSNVHEDAQFLIIDEYGYNNRLSIDNLKKLTSGNASTFAGNRKSYGSSYTPRSDAQLIVFSNHHLFECMGGSRDRKITRQLATILMDRFYIFKLDEDRGTTDEEEEDRKRFTDT